MHAKEIGIILLLGLLILGLIGANIPYTANQFIIQNTDANYINFFNGDFNGKILYVDWNTISFIDANIGGGGSISSVWGTITGTLSNQTDLQNALNLKLNISDYIDTNAQTACPDDQVLFGDGTCRTPISSTTYYPSSANVSGGTIVDNNIELMWYYNSGVFEVEEGNGVNPLDLNILFTDVNSFDQLILREYYLGSSSHMIQVQFWDWVDGDWEDYFDFVGQSGYTVLTIPVYDPASHISPDGNVLFRFHHIQNGISSHKLYIDFAWLLDGEVVGGSTNLDGYAKYNFGFNNFDGNGNFITTGDMNANRLFQGGNVVCDASGNCGNSSGVDVNAIVWVQSKDGNYTFYQQTLNTDINRGNVLRTAVTNATDGDIIYLAGNTFDIG